MTVIVISVELIASNPSTPRGQGDEAHSRRVVNMIDNGTEPVKERVRTDRD